MVQTQALDTALGQPTEAGAGDLHQSLDLEQLPLGSTGPSEGDNQLGTPRQ